MSKHENLAPDPRGEKFIADVFADWEANGAKVLATLREEKPADYVRIAAAVLPKERHAKPEPLDQLTDAELFERLVHAAARAGFEIRAGADRDRGGAADEAGAARR